MIVIFATERCVHCKTLKMQYERQNKTFKYLIVGKDITKEAAGALIGEEPKQVPIVINTELVQHGWK